MKVTKNTIVSFRYRMKNATGEVLEDNLNNSPVDYLHGMGSMLPALEDALEGRHKGEQQTISILPETNPGLNESFQFEVIIDQVRMATKEEIQQGKPNQPKSADNCGPGCCC